MGRAPWARPHESIPETAPSGARAVDPPSQRGGPPPQSRAIRTNMEFSIILLCVGGKARPPKGGDAPQSRGPPQRGGSPGRVGAVAPPRRAQAGGRPSMQWARCARPLLQMQAEAARPPMGPSGGPYPGPVAPGGAHGARGPRRGPWGARCTSGRGWAPLPAQAGGAPAGHVQCGPPTTSGGHLQWRRPSQHKREGRGGAPPPSGVGASPPLGGDAQGARQRPALRDGRLVQFNSIMNI
jgi:hypothetical protein